MKVKKYELFLNENNHPSIKVDKTYNIPADKITCTSQIADMLIQKCNLDKKYTESVYIFGLNAANQITGFYELSKGSTTSSSMYYKELFSFALLSGSQKIVMLHNHPDGNMSESSDDIFVKERVSQCCQLLDIEFTDTIIISPNGYRSFL